MTPWIAPCLASLSFTNSQTLLRLMPIDSVKPSNHLILRCPLLLLPSIFPSIRVFSNESALRIRWSKYWSFTFSPSTEYSRLISFRMDWFDFPAVQGNLKSLLQKKKKQSLLQHHSLKASVLWCSVFFMVQFSNPYLIARKTTDLTVWLSFCNLSLKMTTCHLCCFLFLSKSSPHLRGGGLNSTSGRE